MATMFRILFYICVMITLYELICPITNEVVYVGITKNVEVRYNQHKWGSKADSLEKSNWINNLKSKGLSPKLLIVESGLEPNIAKIKERKRIVELINKGNNLFNISDSKLVYQYDVDGNLINVFNTLSEVKNELGITVHMKRPTSGGFIWTNGLYDSSKIDSYNKSKQVKCKQVVQIDKNGTVVNTFYGVREACRITGIDHRSIAQVAGGSKIRKTAGGYLWKYS